MKKYTLIELLIVIAVIALLTSLLLPALSSARKKGKEIACLSNLKEIGYGMFLYLEENSSYLPQSKYWTICMEIEQGGVVPVDCVKCPSSNPPEDTYYVTPISDVIGYGMNIYINDHRFGDFKYPSQTLVMCDANVYQFDLYYWGSRIIPRHRSGINVLFLDCHVRWQNQETTINRDKTMWTVYDTP